MKFGHLIERNRGNISLEKSHRKDDEETSPISFSEK